MNFLTGIALLLLTAVGYSSGAVWAGGNRKTTPELLDLTMLSILCVLALFTRPFLGRWLAILVWLAFGFILSAGLTALRAQTYPVISENRLTRLPSSVTRSLWERWKRFSSQMGNYQGRLLLAFFYFIVVLPFGLGVRLLGDPLRVKHVRNSAWIARPDSTGNIDEVFRQF